MRQKETLCVMVVKDFRLYDENSSSKGRSPAAHIAKTSRACVAATRSSLDLCRNK